MGIGQVLKDLDFKKRGSNVVAPDASRIAGMTINELASHLQTNYNFKTTDNLVYTPGYSSSVDLLEDIDGVAVVNGTNMPAIITQDEYELDWRAYKVTAINLSSGATISANGNVLVPETVEDIKISKIYNSPYTSYLLYEDGSVKVVGQLSDMSPIGTITDTQYWTDVNISDVKDISLGASKGYILTNSGELYSFGSNNSNGELGFIDGLSRNYATLTLTGVDSVVTSGKHGDTNIFTAVLMKDSTVRMAGYGSGGFMGVGNDLNSIALGKNWVTPNIQNVKKIDVSQYHVVALLNDGTIRTWGQNAQCQQGTGNTANQKVPFNPGIDNVKDILVLWDATFLLMENGTVMMAGNGDSGMTGLGDTTDAKVFTTIPGLYDVTYLTGYKYSLYALRSNGELYGWGRGGNGQLGLGTAVNMFEPTLLLSGVSKLSNWVCFIDTTNYIFAIMNDGSVKCTGYNSNGQLGLNNTTQQNSFVTHPALTNVKDIYLGYAATFIKFEDGSFKVMGYNNTYMLGTETPNNKTIPTDLGSGANRTKTIFNTVTETTSEINLSTTGTVSNLTVQLWV